MRFAAGATPFEAFLIGALLVVPIATAYADENAENDAFSVPRAEQIVKSVIAQFWSPVAGCEPINCASSCRE